MNESISCFHSSKFFKYWKQPKQHSASLPEEPFRTKRSGGSGCEPSFLLLGKRSNLVTTHGGPSRIKNRSFVKSASGHRYKSESIQGQYRCVIVGLDLLDPQSEDTACSPRSGTTRIADIQRTREAKVRNTGEGGRSTTPYVRYVYKLIIIP